MWPVEISSAPKKPSRPTIVRIADIGRGADLADHPQQRHLAVALHLHRLVGLGDMVDQQLLILGGADDRRAAVALQFVDQPGADRVHPLDLGKVDDDLLRLDVVQLLGKLADPQDRQIAAEPQDTAAVFDVLAEVCGHRHGHEMRQNPSGGKEPGWTGATYSMIAEVP